MGHCYRSVFFPDSPVFLDSYFVVSRYGACVRSISTSLGKKNLENLEEKRIARKQNLESLEKQDKTFSDSTDPIGYGF